MTEKGETVWHAFDEVTAPAYADPNAEDLATACRVLALITARLYAELDDLTSSFSERLDDADDLR